MGLSTSRKNYSVVIINVLKKEKFQYMNGLKTQTGSTDDHVEALYKILVNGRLYKTYNIGSNNEIRNIDLANTICGLIDQIKKMICIHIEI